MFYFINWPLGGGIASAWMFKEKKILLVSQGACLEFLTFELFWALKLKKALFVFSVSDLEVFELPS